MKNYIFLMFGAVILIACSPVQKLHSNGSYIIDGQNYTHAIYNRASLLTTHPISAFTKASERRKITDVYVVSHGWNYTTTEALAMYRKYIDAVEQQLPCLKDSKEQPTTCPSAAQNFQPYFIFVAWPSTIKPLTDTVSGILPYGLDEALKPVAGAIDDIPLHIFTTWKQTINAKNVAIGKGYAGNFSNQQDVPESNTPYTVDGDQSGIDFPVSKLIYELLVKSKDNGDSYRVHLIGHSYGAKLLLFAGAEATKQWATNYDINDCLTSNTDIVSALLETKGKEDVVKCAKTLNSKRPPLQSMVLFNTAMTPSEMSYQTSFLKTSGSLKHLALIPRKAFVYSNTDYANGLLFNVREALTGAALAQGYEAVNEDVNNDINKLAETWVGSKYAALPLLMAKDALGGVLTLGSAALYSFTDYAAGVAINFPMDFYHHVTSHKFADMESPENTDAASAIPLALGNTVDFFVPIYPCPFNRQEDDLGLFRSSKPGLGKTGLVKLAKGRSKTLNLHQMSSFYDTSSDISQPVFKKLLDKQDCSLGDNTGNDFQGGDKFYSFDASDVFKNYTPIVGSHGELREGKTYDEDSNIRKTVRFIFNYTKMKSEQLQPLLTGK